MEKQLSNKELKEQAGILIGLLEEIESFGDSIKSIVDYSEEAINTCNSVFDIKVKTENGYENLALNYNESNFNLLRTMLDNDMIVLAEQIYTLRKQIGINEQQNQN